MFHAYIDLLLGISYFNFKFTIISMLFVFLAFSLVSCSMIGKLRQGTKLGRKSLGWMERSRIPGK